MSVRVIPEHGQGRSQRGVALAEIIGVVAVGCGVVGLSLSGVSAFCVLSAPPNCGAYFNFGPAWLLGLAALVAGLILGVVAFLLLMLLQPKSSSLWKWVLLGTPIWGAVVVAYAILYVIAH